MYQLGHYLMVLRCCTMICATSAFLCASEVCVNVSDFSEQPLANAWINVTDLAAGKIRSTQSDSKGSACLPGLPEGLYSVETGLTGFLNVRYYPVRISPQFPHSFRFGFLSGTSPKVASPRKQLSAER